MNLDNTDSIDITDLDEDKTLILSGYDRMKYFSELSDATPSQPVYKKLSIFQSIRKLFIR